MYLLLNCWTEKLQYLQMHRAHDVEDTRHILCPWSYNVFFVNAYPLEPLEGANSHVTYALGYWATFCDPRSRPNNVFSCKCISPKLLHVATSNFAGACVI